MILPFGRAKAQLASHIRHAIKRRRLTQLQAGQLMGLDQPKVSALMNGGLAGISSDRPMRFLAALGQDVEIVSRRDRAGAHAAKSAPSGQREDAIRWAERRKVWGA